jgi:subtilisin family serine protease
MKYRFRAPAKTAATITALVISLLAILTPGTTPAAQKGSPVTIARVTAASSPHEFSHRLIVELQSPPAVCCMPAQTPAKTRRRFDPAGRTARAAFTRIDAEQRQFLARLRGLNQKCRLAECCDSRGGKRQHRYRLLFNGLTLTPTGNGDKLAQEIRRLPGVKAVYRDRAQHPALFASRDFIAFPQICRNPGIGSPANAGRGIKIAILDEGLHHLSPMFSGEGFSFPPEIPAPGLGDSRNNNGKIIVSRAYFRDDDPPLPGEENPWPGPRGGIHGLHVGGIAAGNPVTANYYGLELQLSGIAPAAWLMSYRVGYPSREDPDTASYTAEVIAAIEDAVADGADVINYSWAGSINSRGGYYDPLDRTLINASRAGVLVVTSAGNEGPDPATLIHPSADYLTVASCTTDSGASYDTYLRLALAAPAGFDPRLSEIQAKYVEDHFWDHFLADSLDFPLLDAAALGDQTGCRPETGKPFTGSAVLIERGGCDFSVKALNAQQAGAAMVILYNHSEGGDELIDAVLETARDQLDIPVAFIGHDDGLGLCDWCRRHPRTARIKMTLLGHLDSIEPDLISDFSSRGPGTGETLKPDLAAPGGRILSQGNPLTSDDNRHLGYGLLYGTSMATPHVAGAGALLKQIHPDWPVSYLMSALMTTTKFQGLYTFAERPALPLDMGAGRLDLTRAADPGIICEPPSLSFGRTRRGESRKLTITVTNVGKEQESYTVSVFDPLTGAAKLAGVGFSPARLSLEPGAATSLTITLDTAAAGVTAGHLQGYIRLQGEHHKAHLPLWSRVVDTPVDKILLIDDDGSGTDTPLPDCRPCYTTALKELGLAFDTWNTATRPPDDAVPEATRLMGYSTVIYFSGNRASDLADAAADRLAEYTKNGGRLLFMSAVGPDNFQRLRQILGLQTCWSVSNSSPALAVSSHRSAPEAFQKCRFTLGHDTGDTLKQIIGFYKRRLDFITLPDPKETIPLLNITYSYQDDNAYTDGTIAIAHRAQPTLEIPEQVFLGRSIFSTFGLEKINEQAGDTSRTELLKLFLDYLADEPTVTIDASGEANELTRGFSAALASPAAGTKIVSCRWDYGDGTPPHGPYGDNQAHLTFPAYNNYPVRVEAADNWGNRAIGKYLVSPTRQLYYPHITAGTGWDCDICTINTSLTHSVSGAFYLFDRNGDQLASTPQFEVPPGGRREIAALSRKVDQPENIAYAIFVADGESLTGYTKFYQAGRYRAAAPALKETNRNRLFLSHIASTDEWFSRIVLDNLTSTSKALFLTTDNGRQRTLELGPGEHRAFDLRELFADKPQPGIGSATIDNCAGIAGLELFGNRTQLSAIPLRDQSATAVIYPHVADSGSWWTGVVACNCSARAGDIEITAYSENGTVISSKRQHLNGHERLVSSTAALGLPGNTAWLKLESELPMTGFELFGTYDGYMLAGYTGIGIKAAAGILPKLEKAGWTGIAMVNPGPAPATVTLKAYDNEGREVGTPCQVPLAAHSKLARTPEQLFHRELAAATYLRYSADREIIAFQLNGTSDGRMLDALPALH